MLAHLHKGWDLKIKFCPLFSQSRAFKAIAGHHQVHGGRRKQGQLSETFRWGTKRLMIRYRCQETGVVHQKRHILIANRCARTRSTIRRGINAHSRHCYLEIEEADEGYAAFACLEQGSADLAFVDLSWPGHSRHELVKALDHAAQQSCLTIVTSDTLSKNAAETLALAGVYHFLQDPVSTDEAIDCVSNYLKIASTYSVLIVEECQATREMIKATLNKSRFTFQIKEADHAVEAIRILLSAPQDLVLASFELPNIDGLELAGTLRQASSRLPIYMMSTSCSSYLERSAHFVGMTGMLQKPFVARDIDSIMHQILGLNPPHFGKKLQNFRYQSA